MDAVELTVLVEELEALHVHGIMARIGLDLEIGHRRDETLLQFLEVARIGEGKIGGRALEGLDRVCRRRLALGVEMRGERCRGLLRQSLALIEQHAAADGEGRTRRGDGGQQFPSCGHVRYSAR